MKYAFILGLVIVLGSFARSENDSKGYETKVLMGKFLTHMEALKPFFISEEKYMDSNNSQEIEQHLKDLSEIAKKANHNAQLKQESYRISAKVLSDHVSETERIFRTGNKSYSRWMLGSTMSVCMSCHIQVTAASRELKDFEGLKK